MSCKVLISKTFSDEDPLFAVAFHPEKPQFVLGYSSGKLECYKYKTHRVIGEIKSTAPQLVELIWEAKRHKSSIRGLSYDLEARYIYSAGSDNVVKRTNPSTGKVSAKTTLKLGFMPTVLKVTDAFVAIGDEQGSLSVLDLKSLEEKFHVAGIHDDVVTAIIDLEPHRHSKYHFLTTGGITVAHVDARKSKPVKVSDEQEDEVLSGCLISPTLSVCGMSEGVLTVWYNDNPEDQHNRIRLSEESIDCVIAAKEDNEVYAGSSDGSVRLVNAKSGKVLHQWIHSKDQELSMLELDYEYRLVTASMQSLKIWGLEGDVEEKKVEKEENDQGNSNAESDEEQNEKKPKKKRKGKKSKMLNKRPKHGISSFSDL